MNRFVLRHQALRLSMPWIFSITPGGEQQEISGHQPCRHDYRSELLQLFDVHPCIVPLFLSKDVPLRVDGSWFSCGRSSRHRAAPSITVITPSPWLSLSRLLGLRKIQRVIPGPCFSSWFNSFFQFKLKRLPRERWENAETTGLNPLLGFLCRGGSGPAGRRAICSGWAGSGSAFLDAPSKRCAQCPERFSLLEQTPQRLAIHRVARL